MAGTVKSTNGDRWQGSAGTVKGAQDMLGISWLEEVRYNEFVIFGSDLR